MNAPLLLAPPPPPPWEFDGARYYITPELWSTFTVEQIKKQITCLRDTSRLPQLPPDITIRLAVDSVIDTVGGPPDPASEPQANKGNSKQIFLDYHFQDYHFIFTTRVCTWTRKYAHVRLQDRKWFCEGAAAHPENAKMQNERGERYLASWFDHNTFCIRETLNSYQPMNFEVAAQALMVLMIVLQDRTVHKIEIEPRAPQSRIAKKLAERRGPMDPTPEITLHVPARIYTGEHGGTHASPRLHYRAEHIRQQAVGPRGLGQHKEIVIAGAWINAADVDPKDLGTPLRKYKLVAMKEAA